MMSLFGQNQSGKVKKANRLVEEAGALIPSDTAAARRKLNETLALVRTIPEAAPERAQAMGDTLLALAQLERAVSNDARAVQLFEEAIDLGAMPADSDWDYLTEEMAREGRTDAQSIDAYLAFAAEHARELSSIRTGPVYDLLERCCRIDESTPPEHVDSRIALCSRVIAVDGRLGYPYYFRARSAFQAGEYASALDDFKRAGEQGFAAPDLGYCIKLCSGKLRKQEGGLEQAAYYFVEAAKQNPASYTANYDAGSCLVELCRQRQAGGGELGEVDASRRRYAITLLDRACSLQAQSAEAHFALGCAYLLDRRAEEAAAALRRASELQPSSCTIYEYARALRSSGALDEAITAAEEALRLQPELLEARRLIANVAMRQRDFTRAEREYRAIAAALPEQSDGHRNAVFSIGVCSFELGRDATAITAFQWLESQDLLLSAQGALLLARSLVRHGDLAAGEQRLAELAAEPDARGEALYYLGCCRARQGRLEEAIRTLEEAERAGAMPQKVAMQRGLALESLGRLEEACRQYERATSASGPEQEAASQRLTMLCRRMNRRVELLPVDGPSVSIVRAATPLTRLISGERGETAAEWEREFREKRKTETAHHLAILYYWWAVHEGSLTRAASLWQRSVGWWVYVLNDAAYWERWLASKAASYEPDADAVAGLPAALRIDLMEHIGALSASSGAGTPQYVEDLQMDCWAEFEIAALLREAGVEPASGPLLMNLLGYPDGFTIAADADRRSIRLAGCELPFVPGIHGVLTLCRMGLGRTLAYLANGRYDVAEALVRSKMPVEADRAAEDRLVTEMLALVRIRKVESAYIGLKCPPEHAEYEGVRQYAADVRKLIDSIAEVRRYVVTPAMGQTLASLVELICRRTYNEFTSFHAGGAERVRYIEAGVQLLDCCLKLVDGVTDVEEARLHLAAIVNRLALQIDKEAHDRIIELLEWAVRLAADNPHYRRNLAYSYFNRCASRKRRDGDIAAARQDIIKAYQLAPYDADIRGEYQQMVGLARS